MTSTGRVAATTLNHRLQTLGLEITRPCRRPKGHSLPQNSTTTARMAPSWMTTRNMDMNSSLALNLTICSSRIIWPVDEMGSHSVMPSTMPIKIALMISQNVRNPSFLHTRERAAFLAFQYTILWRTAHAECKNFTQLPSALRGVTGPENVLY